ncbi:MAG: glycosyltransferase family 39 protein [Patescibacteria group bacterium]|nr:glycosyltransferase family 39 protein [Patescibacteria group bacterium]
MKNIRNFCKFLNNEKYYPFYILFLSIAVLFFQLDGSIGSWDEAIYCEVAKEGVMRNNWIDFFYKGELWFEKPPFVIWLTMIAYKIFGVTEFASWFFPVIFGILGIVGIYYLGKYLFNSKVGLFAALILLSIPHYALMARNNMMDIFLVSSSVISFLFLIRSKENAKYLVLSAIFLGLAFMSKNVIALLNLPVFFYYLYINRQLSIFKSRYFYLSIIVFLAIILPWHLIMFSKYGSNFVDNYIGYHLIERYSENILHMEHSSNIFHYIKIILQRTGLWWFVFLVALPIILNRIKQKAPEYKKLLFLVFWFVFILIFFTSSVTKLSHYILPAYIPFSLLIAYGLHKYYANKSVLLLLLIPVLFMSISKATILQVSDFGGARLLFPLILHKLFHFPNIIFSLVCLLSGYILYHYFLKSKSLAISILLSSLFIFSFILPFYSDKCPLAKEISESTKGKNIETIYFYDYYECEMFNLKSSLVFYNYPIEIMHLNLENLEQVKFSEGSSAYCLISKTNFHNWYRLKGLNYDFYPCEIVK